MRRPRWIPGSALLCLALLAGCELFDTRGDVLPPEEIDYGAIDEIRFSEHVRPLLQQKAARLLGAEAGLDLTSWDGLIAGSDFGEVVIPFDSENSLLIELATKLDPPHPAQRGPDSLTTEEIAFLRRWIDEGARNDAGQVPYANATQLLYVANQDDASVSVIDMAANLVIRTVKLAELGFSADAKPHHTAVAPDGSRWYVSLIGEGTVLQFDRDNRLVGRADGFETPGMLAMHPDGDRLFVGRSLSAVDPPRSIGILDAETMALETLGIFFQKPHALRVSPDGRYVYTASLVTNGFATYDVAGDEIFLAGVDGPVEAYLQIAVAPDGSEMYVTGQQTGRLSVLDLTDPTRPARVATVNVAPQPWHPVLTPDGGALYVGNKSEDAVTVVDTATRTVVAEIEGPGLAQPHGAAVRADGRYVYISNNNAAGAYTPRYDFGDNARAGTVVVIDTETNAIVKVIEVEALAAGMNTAGG